MIEKKNMENPLLTPKKNKGGRPRKKIEESDLFCADKTTTVDDLPLFLRRRLENPEPIIWAYVRVSTSKRKADNKGVFQYVQTFGSQIPYVARYQNDPRFIFCDRRSGVKARYSLYLLDKIMRPGDSLVVFKIDRIGRSAGELHTRVEEINARGIAIITASDGNRYLEPGATRTALVGGLAIAAEIERENMIDRTRAGQEYIRANGGRIGRKPKCSDMDVKTIIRLHEEGYSYSHIRSQMNAGRENKLGKTTIFNVVCRYKKGLPQVTENPEEEAAETPEEVAFELDGDGDLTPEEEEFIRSE